MHMFLWTNGALGSWMLSLGVYCITWLQKCQNCCSTACSMAQVNRRSASGSQEIRQMMSSLSADQSLWPRPLQAQQGLHEVPLVQDAVFKRCAVHTCHSM